MIVLDTNVISEVMRKEPNQKIVAWINGINTNDLYTTWINIAEIQRGIFRLPTGKRRAKLEINFKQFINKAFLGRVLSFDKAAADFYGELCVGRESKGLHVDPVDLMIAAIAKSHQYKVASRNISDLSSCGVELINPWES